MSSLGILKGSAVTILSDGFKGQRGVVERQPVFIGNDGLNNPRYRYYVRLASPDGRLIYVSDRDVTRP